jgi:hypothetical protein
MCVCVNVKVKEQKQCYGRARKKGSWTNVKNEYRKAFTIFLLTTFPVATDTFLNTEG